MPWMQPSVPLPLPANTLPSPPSGSKEGGGVEEEKGSRWEEKSAEKIL